MQSNEQNSYEPVSNADILLAFYGGEEGFKEATTPIDKASSRKEAAISLAKQISMKERDKKRIEASKKGAQVSSQKRMEKYGQK